MAISNSSPDPSLPEFRSLSPACLSYLHSTCFTSGVKNSHLRSKITKQCYLNTVPTGQEDEKKSAFLALLHLKASAMT